MIRTEKELRDIYQEPGLRAKNKVLDSLEKYSVNFIENSPFLLISSVNSNGQMDVSPKGGEPGFVKIADSKTLLIPDLSGNNRIDNLVNIVETGHFASIFLIPGIDETLRVNGKAFISTDLKYLQAFDTEFKAPKTCIVVEIEEVFLHCAKAFMRSDLWGDSFKKDPKQFPSMGVMLKSQLRSKEEAETREEMQKRYLDGL